MKLIKDIQSLSANKMNFGTKLFCYSVNGHVIVLNPDVLAITHTGNGADFQ
jgi:hypothetical protein